jgi:hypothetical protein
VATAGWYPDPYDGRRLRQWDGTTWTTWVTAGGHVWQAPLAPTPSPPAAYPTTPPPHYVTANRPASTEPFRSLKGLSVALLVLFIVNAVAHAAAALSLYGRAALVNDYRHGGDVSLTDLADADDEVTTVLGLGTFVLVAIFVLLIIWLWRAYSNTRALGATPWRWARGWAVGGWFIPLANFVIPKMLINDVWRGADARAPGNPRWRKLPVAAIVTVWWVLWAGSTFLVRATTFDTEVTSPDKLVVLDVVAGTIGLLCVAASITGAVAIRKMSRRQHDSNSRLLSVTA